MEGVILVTYPWSDQQHAFTGIPPHVVLLQELTIIKKEQRSLILNFVNKVKEAIEETGVGGGGAVTEAKLKELFASFTQELRSQLVQLDEQGRLTGHDGYGGNVAGAPNRVETGVGYRFHTYGGRIHRLPSDWGFPRVGVLDIWRQWWIGDNVRMVPPLRSMTTKDFEHLDRVPLAEDEMHGRTGKSRTSRQPARKILCQLAFLMGYITRKMEEAGAMP